MFLVYTVWACLKGMTPYNTFKEESSQIKHYDDSYSASIYAMLALSFASNTHLRFALMEDIKKSSASVMVRGW